MNEVKANLKINTTVSVDFLTHRFRGTLVDRPLAENTLLSYFIVLKNSCPKPLAWQFFSLGKNVFFLNGT